MAKSMVFQVTLDAGTIIFLQFLITNEKIPLEVPSKPETQT